MSPRFRFILKEHEGDLCVIIIIIIIIIINIIIINHVPGPKRVALAISPHTVVTLDVFIS